MKDEIKETTLADLPAIELGDHVWVWVNTYPEICMVVGIFPINEILHVHPVLDSANRDVRPVPRYRCYTADQVEMLCDEIEFRAKLLLDQAECMRAGRKPLPERGEVQRDDD